MDSIHKELLKKAFCVTRLSISERSLPQRHLPQIRIRGDEALECGSVACYPGPAKTVDAQMDFPVLCQRLVHMWVSWTTESNQASGLISVGTSVS